MKRESEKLKAKSYQLKARIIGIDASRAFLKRRTGIEEYSYQVIRHLRDAIPETDRVVLYIRSDQDVDFELPKNWEARKLWAPRLWTQGRLSLEMLFHSPDVLFVPAHIVPVVHPVRTIVTVHGLEYEVCPEGYSFYERWYMRLSIRLSSWAASRVIAVSENTKRDLMWLYHVPEGKISVVHEGYAQGIRERGQSLGGDETQSSTINHQPYLLFIGRLEERKNIVRIIEAFWILKGKYHIPHKLVLAGKPGYGYDRVRNKIQETRYKDEIRELGYVSEEEKEELLKNADVFLFPTLYEGFGLPVLEAQAVGTPVVASNVSSLPEVGGVGALYADPSSAEDIAEKAWKLLSDSDFRGSIMEKGRKNVEKFSWEKCAHSIAILLHG